MLCYSCGILQFSPEIFTDPEVYIHSKEPTEEIANMTGFLNHEAAPPLTIRPGAFLEEECIFNRAPHRCSS